MTTAAKNIPDVFKRVERKYLLTPAQYEELLDRMSDRVGDDAFPHSLIQSMYYDTPVHGMICRSLEKPVYKEKLRVRAYGYPTPDSPVYVELKKKFKGIVYKRRVGVSQNAAAAFMAGADYVEAVTAHPLPNPEQHAASLSRKALQIAAEIDACCNRWGRPDPQMMIIVQRDALRSFDGTDVRFTFDHDPLWREHDLGFAPVEGNNQLLPDGRILMEVKFLNAYPLWLANLLTDMQVYPCSYSKYGRAFEASHPRQMPKLVLNTPDYEAELQKGATRAAASPLIFQRPLVAKRA